MSVVATAFRPDFVQNDGRRTGPLRECGGGDRKRHGRGAALAQRNLLREPLLSHCNIEASCWSGGLALQDQGSVPGARS